MPDWISENYSWVFSGAGVFAISSLVSFLSVLLTLWYKRRSEERGRRKLEILTKTTAFSLPEADRGEQGSSELRVSYAGVEYEHLYQYSIAIANVGLVAIEGQQILVSIPSEATVLKSSVKPSRAIVTCDRKTVAGPSGSEEIFSFGRLEPGDTCSISFLVNGESPALLNCEPRGVDEIDYILGQAGSRSEVESLMYLLALFVFSDFVPSFGNLIQGLIVLSATPFVVQIVRIFGPPHRKLDNAIRIHGDVVLEGGDFQITQNTDGL